MTNVCRICLAVNRRLYEVKNNLLLMLYENLTKSKFNSEDARTRALCTYCYQKLLRCYTFSQMALRSDQIISHLYDKGPEVTHEYITQVNQNMKQQLSMANMKFIVIGDNATNAGPQVIVYDELLPSINIKEEVTTEPDKFVVEDHTKSPLTSEEDNDQGNGDVEEVLLNVPRTKPTNSKIPFICHSCNKIYYLKRKLISHIRISHYQATGAQHSSTKKQTETTSLIKVKKNKNEKNNPGGHEYDKTYDDKFKLIQHNRTPTGEKPFACDVCDKRFKKKSYFVVHSKTHIGEKPFACNVCDKRFNLKHYLVEHMRTHTGEKPFACNVCDKLFNRKSYLAKHMRIHTGEKPLACNVCDKRFYDKSSLILHKGTHTGEKPFACNVCDKLFYRKYYLANHMRIHTSEKRFACNVCCKRFNHKQHLIEHIRIHTGEKPFACNVCDKQFNKKSNLVSHMRVHTGEKPFFCYICDKRFTFRSTLVPHMRTHR